MKIIEVDHKNENLLSMLQTYEAEFSKITKKQPDEKGIYKLDVDLKETDNYLLLQNESPIGFCVKGISEDRHDIYEFYISPEQRGKSLGREFAKEIFAKYKGDWQVRQILGADLAIQFWRKAISEFTSGQFEELVVIDEYWGKVTKQVFMSDRGNS